MSWKNHGQPRQANGIRATERCACGNRATHYKSGPRCDTCREIEERIGSNYAAWKSGVPGYYRDPYTVQVPNQDRSIRLLA